jgi:hypothetical protein
MFPPKLPAILLINAAVHCRLVWPLAIRLLRLDRLGHRVHELIGLPEALLLLGEIHALLHEGLAVGVLVVDLIGSDTRHVGAMREHHAVQSIDHDAEIVVYELAGGLSIPV